MKIEELPSEYLDVRFQIDIAEAKLPPNFTIITAFNPQGKILTIEDNLAANHSLELALRDLSVAIFGVTGGSIDMAHSEPGFACEADPGVILALARRWQQLAIYQVEGDELYLVSCKNGDKMRLNNGFRARVLKFG